MKRLLLVFVGCSFWMISPVLGQQKLISLGIGTNAYRGDLSNQFDKWSASYHVGIHFRPDKKINSTVNLGIGNLSGENPSYEYPSEDIPLPSPNRFFKTSFFQFSLEVNYNFFKWKGIAFFISQGIGLLRYNPEDQFNDNLQDQPATRPPGESYGNITLMLPTQLGARYQFKNGYGLGIQSGLMNSLTDYLDNIGEWGIKSGNDNALFVRFNFFIPINQTNSPEY